MGKQNKTAIGRALASCARTRDKLAVEQDKRDAFIERYDIMSRNGKHYGREQVRVMLSVALQRRFPQHRLATATRSALMTAYLDQLQGMRGSTPQQVADDFMIWVFDNTILWKTKENG